jgi:RHS repeat-associated protein
VRDSEGNLAAEYYYDPFGRRLWKTLYPGAEGHPGGAEPVREYLAYSDEGYAAEAGALLGVAPASAAIRLSLFVLDGWWSTDPILHLAAGAIMFLQTDHLGAPIGAAMSASSSLEAHRMAAFGETRGASFSRFRLAGQLSDAESGLLYNRYRSYDSDRGNYLEFDTAWRESGEHMYAYAAGNPVNRIDPLGLASTTICCQTARRLGVGFQSILTNHEDRGMVVCCFGAKHACSNLQPERYEGLALQSLDSCTESHEEVHFSDVDCASCEVGRPPLREEALRQSSECAGYLRQMHCLSTRVSMCGNDPVCSDQIRAEIRRVQRRRADYACGA